MDTRRLKGEHFSIYPKLIAMVLTSVTTRTRLVN